ncbi:pantoate--beta-alanine ligase [Yinghuangia sp. YIM S10712]|uniref:pantoate--beta-alanine ligase n=1 Tax=Yinghuangia sp. YIM S10712 TaxID=3436930 RepID=UPI003F52E5B0
MADTRNTVLAQGREEFEEVYAAYASAPAVAVVMTMGALHEGHATLIRTARERVGHDGAVLVTVFVNPLQFGVNEDLDRYPRTLDADLVVCQEAGADLVFAPSVEDVYPDGAPLVRISAGPVGAVLEGASRPGHFDGMLTVVAKLLHLTEPFDTGTEHIAFYGQKDAQQLALIRRMVADLNFRTEVVAVPTVREVDGLALSSRNRYLGLADRATALALSRALRAGEAEAAHGAAAVCDAASAVLAEAAHATPPLVLDYLALVDPTTFAEVPANHFGPAVLAVAARVGTTRLIDNVPLVIAGARS